HLPWLNMSTPLESLGDLPAATAAARRAVELAPHDERSNRRLLVLLLQAGNDHDSLEAARRMTEYCPHVEAGRDSRVKLLQRLRRVAEADEVARQAAGYVPYKSSKD